MTHLSYDADAPCRHCLEHVAWDGLFAVYRDEDGLVACFDGGPHEPVPERSVIIAAVLRADLAHRSATDD